MRSCAEVLRLLAERTSWDVEEKDMCAFIVFNLRTIHDTIEESAQAWDDRNYWKKAETLRDTWRWARTGADQLSGTILASDWNAVPPLLVSLIPHFAGITVTAVTRDSDWWCGALRALQKSSGSSAVSAHRYG